MFCAHIPKLDSSATCFIQSRILAPALLLAPLQKFTEQRLSLLRREALRSRPCCSGRSKTRCSPLAHPPWANALEHLLRDAPAGPARDRRRQIDVAPFGMARRLAKLVPFGEQVVDEPLNPPVAVVALRPIEHREHRRHGERIDGLPFRHQRRIVLARQLAERVVVGEGLRETESARSASRNSREFSRRNRSVFRSRAPAPRARRS